MMRVAFLYVAAILIVIASRIDLWATTLAAIGTMMVLAYVLSDIRRI